MYHAFIPLLSLYSPPPQLPIENLNQLGFAWPQIDFWVKTICLQSLTRKDSLPVFSLAVGSGFRSICSTGHFNVPFKSTDCSVLVLTILSFFSPYFQNLWVSHCFYAFFLFCNKKKKIFASLFHYLYFTMINSFLLWFRYWFYWYPFLPNIGSFFGSIVSFTARVSCWSMLECYQTH